uniref:Pleckstrin homology domain containing B1 n=1 Tax=Leptobrachium leishanense TaxID=445787 RepID=A0A8C5PBP0_9ANUR
MGIYNSGGGMCWIYIIMGEHVLDIYSIYNKFFKLPGVLSPTGSILKRWKKHWFDLWMDGSLIYYPDENRGNLEERILLKFHCLSIKSGADCGDVQPPEGSPQDAMLLIHLRDHTRIYLCAESQDDAVAWKMALEDAKYFPVYVYDPYDDHYQAVPMNAHHAVYTDSGYGHCGYAHGVPHVLVRQNPYDRYGEQLALGLLAGAVTGSALSSLMWLPCWF